MTFWSNYAFEAPQHWLLTDGVNGDVRNSPRLCQALAHVRKTGASKRKDVLLAYSRNTSWISLGKLVALNGLTVLATLQ